MQVHQLGRQHQVVVQIGHDPQRAANHQRDDQHAKRQRQYVIGIVRSGGDVQRSSSALATKPSLPS
jgi:hypothetical protein